MTRLIYIFLIVILVSAASNAAGRPRSLSLEGIRRIFDCTTGIGSVVEPCDQPEVFIPQRNDTNGRGTPVIKITNEDEPTSENTEDSDPEFTVEKVEHLKKGWQEAKVPSSSSLNDSDEEPEEQKEEKKEEERVFSNGDQNDPKSLRYFLRLVELIRIKKENANYEWEWVEQLTKELQFWYSEHQNKIDPLLPKCKREY